MQPMLTPEKPKLLITGSEGRIGQQLVRGLGNKYDIVRFDLVHGNDANDPEQLFTAAEGSFGVIHTAFNLSQENSRSGFRGDPNNMAMGRFALEAAAAAGARHCIMASSVHAARTTNATNWSYRTTKLHLEWLATQFAEQFPETTFTSIRYGRVKKEDTPPEESLRPEQTWLSAHDHRSLISAILASNVRGAYMIYGVSKRPNPPYPTDNPFGWAPQSEFGS